MTRRTWTQAEEKFLADNIMLLGVVECAVKLQRPESSVYHKMQRMGLRDSRWWTPEEESYLIKHYKKDTVAAISQALNRSGSGVEGKAKKLGLTSQNTYPPKRYCIDCGKELANKYMQPVRCRKCEKSQRSGAGHPMWNGGICSLNQAATHALVSWKKAVLKRDGNECVVCGNTNNLNVHHLRTYAYIRDFVIRNHPEITIHTFSGKKLIADLIALEHDIKDGVTLCSECHKKIHAAKRGELLENPNTSGEDNQQPSQSKVVYLVDWKVQRLMGEDTTSNKPDTSAPASISLNGVRYSLSCIVICRSSELNVPAITITVYSKGSSLSSDDRDIVMSAQFQVKHAYANATTYRIDELENSGPEAQIDLLATKLETAQQTISDTLADSLYDAPGGASTRLTGLRSLCNETTSTTYGGIAEDDLAAEDGTKPWEGKLYATTEILKLDTLRDMKRKAKINDGPNGKPDLFVTTETIWNAIESMLQVQQRLTEGKETAKAGFTGLVFIGMEIFPDDYCPSSHAFALNSKYVGFGVHKNGNFVRTPWMVIPDSPNDRTMKILWDGNLICSNRKAHQGYSAITA